MSEAKATSWAEVPTITDRLDLFNLSIGPDHLEALEAQWKRIEIRGLLTRRDDAELVIGNVLYNSQVERKRLKPVRCQMRDDGTATHAAVVFEFDGRIVEKSASGVGPLNALVTAVLLGVGLTEKQLPISNPDIHVTTRSTSNALGEFTLEAVTPRCMRFVGHGVSFNSNDGYFEALCSLLNRYFAGKENLTEVRV